MVLHYTPLDWACIGLLATGTAVQFLRGVRDFSRVLYETGLLVAALVGTNALYRPLSQLVRVQGLAVYITLFVLFFVVSLLLAALLNRVVAFGFGAFNYLLALLAGFVYAYAAGHVLLRVALNLVGRSNPAFSQAVMRSWMARELLFFKTWIEILAQLRQVRWLNI